MRAPRRAAIGWITTSYIGFNVNVPVKCVRYREQTTVASADPIQSVARLLQHIVSRKYTDSERYFTRTFHSNLHNTSDIRSRHFPTPRTEGCRCGPLTQDRGAGRLAKAGQIRLEGSQPTLTGSTQPNANTAPTTHASSATGTVKRSPQGQHNDAGFAHETEIAQKGVPEESSASLNNARRLVMRDSLFDRLRRPKTSRFTPDDSFPEKPAGISRFVEEPMPIKEREPVFFRGVHTASTEVIEEELQYIARNKPNVNGVQFMLKELIEKRHVVPHVRHYEALILSNCDSGQGSAAALYPILDEMEREKMGVGVSTLRAVLKVLSVHPDPILLASTLSMLSKQWASPTTDTKVHTILAFARLNQFELAISHLEHFISTSPPPDNCLHSQVPPFVYLTLLYRLASPAISDHTATLHLLYILEDNNLPISNVCISYLLDTAAEALHLDLTLHLWRSHVDHSYIVPSNGLCRNALLTAARSGNSELAIKAGRALEVRGTAVTERQRRNGDQSAGIGLKTEELEMIKDAFLADRRDNGQIKVGVKAVDKLQKRMLELRRREEGEGMEGGKGYRR